MHYSPPVVRTALLLALLLPGAAMAQVRPITVALEAEPSGDCTLDELAGEVETRLRREVFVGAADAEFVVRVLPMAETPQLGRRIVVEQLGRPIGERRVEVESCEELRDRAALIIALVVDTQLPLLPPVPEATTPAGDASGGASTGGAAASDEGPIPAAPAEETSPADTMSPEGGDTTSPEEEAPEEFEEPEEEATAEPRGEPLEVRLALVGAAHVGWFPSVAGGAGLGVAVRGRRWAVHADALGWVPDDSLVQDPVSMRLYGAALRLGGCGGGDLGRVHLVGCGVVEVGALRVEGQGLDEPESLWRFSLRGGLEVRATLAIRALRLALALGVDVPLVRDRFVFSDADESTQVAHEPGLVGGIALLGVGLAF